MVWSEPADGTVATATFPRGVVACVHQEYGDDPGLIYGGFPPEQTLANAYLIAAAPDMLAALRAALPELRRPGTRTARAIRAAIKKATTITEEVEPLKSPLEAGGAA